MSLGVTVLNQIHRKSQGFDVNAREQRQWKESNSVCVCAEGECVGLSDRFCVCVAQL